MRGISGAQSPFPETNVKPTNRLQRIMEAEKAKICVTGGAGFVASWLITRLLQRGYSVRATVRLNPEFKEDTSHLRSLPGAAERLEIVDADLRYPESFEAAIDGCTGVFHLAHPIIFDAEDPDSDVIAPALAGTLAILRACLRSPTVRRVVLTSSSGAAVFSGKEDLKEIDESVWTDVEMCSKIDIPIASYCVSKTLTERAALDFAKEHGLDLVTVLPACVVGPIPFDRLPDCFLTSLALIRGDPEYCKLLKQMEFVHLDDLVSAHIFLFECPEAQGRYICSAVDTTIHSLARFLSNKFPEFKMPTELLSEMEEEEPIHLSSKKLLKLGFQFKYGLEEMFEDAVRSCKQKGFL